MSAARDAARAQRKGDVLEHGEVRIQRVILEDHRDVARRGLDVVDDAIADPDAAGVRALETRQQPQERRLAAARRAEQHEALARVDVEIDGAQRRVRAESLRHALESHSHAGVILRRDDGRESRLDANSAGTRAWDVVGVGANSVDYVHLLPGYPQPFGSFAKMKIERQEILCGGQMATAMCACARLGLRARTPASPAPTRTAGACAPSSSAAASISPTSSSATRRISSP